MARRQTVRRRRIAAKHHRTGEEGEPMAEKAHGFPARLAGRRSPSRAGSRRLRRSLQSRPRRALASSGIGRAGPGGRAKREGLEAERPGGETVVERSLRRALGRPRGARRRPAVGLGGRDAALARAQEGTGVRPDLRCLYRNQHEQTDDHEKGAKCIVQHHGPQHGGAHVAVQDAHRRGRHASDAHLPEQSPDRLIGVR